MAGNNTNKLLNAYRAAFRGRKYRLILNARLEGIRETLSLVRPVHTGYDLVRIGGEGDGGYLVPDDFEGMKTCFSPGVSFVSDFEEHIARNYGIH